MVCPAYVPTMSAPEESLSVMPILWTYRKEVLSTAAPRFRIFNSSQHPFVHDPSQFAYSNPRLPDITLLSDAIDYLINVVYPNYKGTVADVASLPLIRTVTANDYYIVDDDGDGKSAGYVAANIEGTLQWYKRYDVDWTYEGILGAAVDRTSYLYVHKMGMTDKDASGADIVGTYAGQIIYGGNASGLNLTLNANSAATDGFVQTDNTFRPPVSGNENHQYYIKKIENRMKKPDFRYLSPEIQQNYQLFKQVHEKFFAEQTQQAQMATSGFVPVGGALVACDMYVNDPVNPEKAPKRVRVPYQALDWLLGKLNAQGMSLQTLEQMQLAPKAEVAQMMNKNPAPQGQGEQNGRNIELS